MLKKYLLFMLICCARFSKNKASFIKNFVFWCVRSVGFAGAWCAAQRRLVYTSTRESAKRNFGELKLLFQTLDFSLKMCYNIYVEPIENIEGRFVF